MLRFKQNFISGRLVGFVIWAFLFTISYDPLTHSWAQEKCETALADAERHFNDGRLDEVMKILESCLPEGLKNEDKSKAYRLLSLTYMGKEYLEQAKQSIEKLLELVPNWQPDPDQDPPPFTRMVEEIRKEMAEEQKAAAPKEPVEQPQEKPTEIEKPREEPVAEPAQPKKGGSKVFLWIGLGVAAIGGGILGLAGGGGGGNGGPPITGGPDRLPDPPGDPGN